VDAGQAQTSVNKFSDLFDSSRLGSIEIYQKTVAKVYQGVAITKIKASQLANSQNSINIEKSALDPIQENINIQKADLEVLKTKMTSYYDSGETSLYNSLVPSYNDLVNVYNAAVKDYKTKVDVYNINVNIFNQNVNNFYQK
jgi:hypothetical protein